MNPKSSPAGEAADNEIVLSRVLNAPRALVWEAWTNPRHVANWWGPRGFTTTIKQMDFRVGGVWEHTMHGPDGKDYPNRSTFKEIVPLERITYLHGGASDDERQGVGFTAVWTFETVEGDKTLLTGRMIFGSKESRDRVVREFGAIEGGRQTLERASEYVATMTAKPKLRVHCYSISIDGFGAGPNQSLNNPLGAGAEGLHAWMFRTRTLNEMIGTGGGETGADDDLVARGNANIGAWILGRNMFTPERGPWQDFNWKGWWGDNPPYHVPVFILTHHAREPITMAGGTTFHFVTGGIEEALKQAFAAAGGRDVRVGGGAATIRQYLKAGLIDEMHVAVSPVLLGSGENLYADIDLLKLGYEIVTGVPSKGVTHYMIKKRS
jgi:uncharacterized protein YndB with AHSA1/START domain/dihydrofolate reductase